MAPIVNPEAALECRTKDSLTFRFDHTKVCLNGLQNILNVGFVDVSEFEYFFRNSELMSMKNSLSIALKGHCL